MLLLPKFCHHLQTRSRSSYGFVIPKIARSFVQKMFLRYFVNEPGLVLSDRSNTFPNLFVVRKFVYRIERIYLTSSIYS